MSLGLALKLANAPLFKGVGVPSGYILLTDEDGALLIDQDGAYLMEPI